MLKRICKICRKEFWIYPSSLKIRKRIYCSNKCHGQDIIRKKEFLGKKHHNWKGGRYKDIHGYIWIYMPKHPFTTVRSCVLEHRLILEKHLKRYLKPKETGHHSNGIKNDNRLQNLILFKNKTYHSWFHKKGFCNPKGIIFDGRTLCT